MNINNMIYNILSESFNPRDHFSKRFKKYGTTKSGRVRGIANVKSNVKAYELGLKHGLKQSINDLK